MENLNYINRRPFLKQHWVLPILLAIFVLPVLVVLPWQAQKIEFVERQEQLIADTLWLEQGVRTLLLKDEDFIRILGEDILNNRITTAEINDRCASLLKNHPEFQQIVWLDANNQVRYGTRPFHFEDFSLNSQQSILQAYSDTHPQYSQPAASATDSKTILIDYHYPLFHGQNYVGVIVASYRPTTILDKVVPWWFASDNEITIIDIDDSPVAHRADGGVGRDVFTHSKSLDLPGINLILKANSNKSFPRLLSNYLVVVVVLLGLGLSWSLWALWRDIVRRQAAEAALRSEIAFRNAMENSLVTGLRVRSMDGRLVYVNSAFCEMLGATQEQLVGQNGPFSFWTVEAVEEFSNNLAGRGKMEPLHGFETVYKHADGHKIPVLIHESALLNEDGVQTGWMGSVLDIADRKKIELTLRQHEEKLQRSARLSTMGELASVMAHELNQPLTAINTYASGILNMMESGAVNLETIKPALAQMQRQAFRAAQIIRSVHDFVAKRGPSRLRMQFGDVFENVLPLIEMQAKSYLITLKIDIQPSLPDLFLDPISLEQVILNLTRNALQSMQELNLDKRVLKIVAQQTGTLVQVDVIDNGSGISKDIADRLFSSFFSTKADGMGMGLNICRTIIEFHGGQLSFRENPLGGTIFSFTIPVFNETNLAP